MEGHEVNFATGAGGGFPEGKRAIVAIPLYRENMSENEELSFRRNTSVLGKDHPVAAFAPEGMDLSLYTGIFPQLMVERFPAHFFRSVKDYSRLLLSEEFYERFSSYEWLLVCQLDAWVFRDELLDWCRDDYDYIGAPIPATWEPDWDGKVADIVGNGGFSLRRVSACLNVLREGDVPMYSPRSLKEFIARHLRSGHIFRILVPLCRLAGIGNTRRACLKILRKQGACEDMVFRALAQTGGLRMADLKTAARFALDGEFLWRYFDHCGGKPPFGLHAWHRKEGQEFMKRFPEQKYRLL